MPTLPPTHDPPTRRPARIDYPQVSASASAEFPVLLLLLIGLRLVTLRSKSGRHPASCIGKASGYDTIRR